jgi:hypothetical protein
MNLAVLEVCEKYLSEAYGKSFSLKIWDNSWSLSNNLLGSVEKRLVINEDSYSQENMVLIPRWQCLIDPRNWSARSFLFDRLGFKRPEIRWIGCRLSRFLNTPYLRPLFAPNTLASRPSLPNQPAKTTGVTGLGDLVLGDYPYRVKLFSFTEKKLINFARSESQIPLLQSDVEARNIALETGVSTPPVLAINQDNTWSLEPLVSGRPLGDLADSTWPVIERVFEELFGYYQHSGYEWVNGKDFFEDRFATVRQAIRDAGAKGKELAPLLEAVHSWLGLNVESCGKLALTSIHGDFHVDNILWDDERAENWLVDWEYSRHGPVWADLYFLIVAWSRWRNPRFVIDWLCGIPPKVFSHPKLSRIIKKLEQIESRPASPKGRVVHFGLVLVERVAAIIDRVGIKTILATHQFNDFRYLFQTILVEAIKRV